MNVGKIIKYYEHGTGKQIILLKQAGEGGFGTVFKGMLEGYGLVAVKYQNRMTEFHVESTGGEIAVAETISDQYAILLMKVIINPADGGYNEEDIVATSTDVPVNSIITVYPFVDGVDLFDLIALNRQMNIMLSKNDAEKYVRMLLSCLKELDDKSMSHRDIKPENLMLDKGSIKMIDFAFSCLYDECEGKRGTYRYLPPEFFILENLKNWPKIDVYSFGITILFLLSNGYTTIGNIKPGVDARLYFTSMKLTNLRDMNRMELEKLGQKYARITDYFPLIMGMIDPDVNLRWTATQCVHWFVDNV